MAPVVRFATELALQHPVLAGATLLLIVVWGVHQLFFAIRYPSNLPRVGAKSFFGGLRARWRFHTDAPGLYREVYENYSKKGKTVLVPGLAFHDDVVLPPTALRWLQRQPERLVSASAAQVETIQPFYGFGHEKFIQDPWTGLLVKTDLNAVLESVCSAMNDELGLAIDSRFGTDTEAWKEIDLIPTVRMIIAQASTRFTLGGESLGRELCRNKEYLQACIDIADALVLCTGVALVSPQILRPLLGRLGAIPAKRQMKDLEKFFEPVYRERMRIIEEEAKTPGIETPEDHLQMMLRFGMRERRDEALNLEAMTKRLCLANFGSMHQTSIQVVNMLLNILESNVEYNTIAVLRDEVARVVGDNTTTGWNKSRVAAMTKADSVARETTRLYAFGSRNVSRKIIGDGVVTEDGIALPKGVVVSILSYQSQTDKDVFEDPSKFDPFRFSRIREAATEQKDNSSDLANLSFVSTGARNLAFSHGKHACPGRFLVDFELKMVIAYMLMNYDIEFAPEHNGKRPPNVWRTEVNFPPDVAKIRVRRRECTY